ncbi:MAG: hypothetical protein ACOX1S_03980 [Anaerostipes sp.]|jgi:hypothetical protein
MDADSLIAKIDEMLGGKGALGTVTDTESTDSSNMTVNINANSNTDLQSGRFKYIQKHVEVDIVNDPFEGMEDKFLQKAPSDGYL